MNPTEALAKTLNVNPHVARLIYGGLAVLAAAALVISWGSNLEDLWLGAVFVLLFAFVVAILSIIARNGVMSTVVAWVVICVFGVWSLGLVGSLVGFPRSLPPTACYLRALFELPEQCMDRLRNKANDVRIGAVIGRRGDAPVWQAAAGGGARLWRVQYENPEPTRHAGQVYIQFTGPIRRGTMIDLAHALADLNWRIQDADAGGEKVKQGPKTNEVRYYTDADREAALELARTIHALHPEQPIYVRDFTRLGSFVKDGTLELWVTQPLGPGVAS